MLGRVRSVWIDLKSSLWLVPGLMTSASIVAASLLVEYDASLGSDWIDGYPRTFGVGADGSRGMLTAIASSMLTVAALAFSLTLNAVTQASGQFTPRIFRNFLRDRANQFVLGYFVSVFAYCLVVLRTIRGGDEDRFVPSIAVISGLALALGGILVLIYFIHHIAKSLQITTILERVAEETLERTNKLFPRRLAESPDAESDVETDIFENDSKYDWQPILSTSSGYVQLIDADSLAETADECSVHIRLNRQLGDFVGIGGRLAEISRKDLDDGAIADIRGALSLSRYRTIEQDVGFGIRQLVDIALKALSPGINDTTTAISCIHRIGDVIGDLASRRMPHPIRTANDKNFVMVLRPSFEDYVRLGFDEIRTIASSSIVLNTQLEALRHIASRTDDDDRREQLINQIDLIGNAAQENLRTEYERQEAARAVSKVRREMSDRQ